MLDALAQRLSAKTRIEASEAVATLAAALDLR
jgi:hypothetical protein